MNRFHLPKNLSCGQDNDHDPHIPEHNKYKLAPCLWQYKLNRKRALRWIIVIVIVALNCLQSQFFRLPTGLLFYIPNFCAGNKNRNLSGCEGMTAEQQRSLRNRNLGGCEKNAFLTYRQASRFVALPENNHNGGFFSDGAVDPSHITLCREFIYRHNEAKDQEKKNFQIKDSQDVSSENSKNPFLSRNPFLSNKIKTSGTFEVHESQDVCNDWERPHSSLMQIISSSIVAFVGGRFNLSYTTNCHSTILSNSNSEFDVTTAQQIFPQNSMPLHENKLSLDKVVFDLCQRCVDQETDSSQKRREMNKQHIEDAYHCLLFPNMRDAHTDNIQRQEGGRSTEETLEEQDPIFHPALDAVLPLIRSRLYHTSIDWSPKAHIPSRDPTVGAVIYLDAANSSPIPFHFFRSHLPQLVKHVSIISSPRCVKVKLGSVDCYEYGVNLQKHLQKHFDGVEVSFDLISSTATAYSRMILSHILICPPDTITCLLPALSREGTKKSIIFESSEQRNTFYWFKYLAKSASISMVPVEDDILVNDEQLSKEEQNHFLNNEVNNFEGDESFVKSFGRFDGGQHNYDFSEGKRVGHSTDLSDEVYKSKASFDSNLLTVRLPKEENDETLTADKKGKDDETQSPSELDKAGTTKDEMVGNAEVAFSNTGDRKNEKEETFFGNVRIKIEEEDESGGELPFVNSDGIKTSVEETDFEPTNSANLSGAK